VISAAIKFAEATCPLLGSASRFKWLEVDMPLTKLVSASLKKGNDEIQERAARLAMRVHFMIPHFTMGLRGLVENNKELLRFSNKVPLLKDIIKEYEK
jgi:hypothetical protein